MSRFDELVREQLKTMDKLLFLQSEIERCQQIEMELNELHNNTELQSVKEDIRRMKEELKEIHTMFEMQTEEVISSYKHNQEKPLTTVS
ncbi:hypothetical protein FZW96_19185 [Bacillus sp. BGMRC 2118]|nr:hypothetical protein FZW96_19185 [Bacillus sp. BGMRC 2118]